MEKVVQILDSKAAFVKGNVSKGQAPSPAQLSSFLSALRNELGPVLAKCSPEVSRQLKKGFAFVGWDVKTNRCISASPPPIDKVIYFLEKAGENVKGLVEKMRASAVPTDDELQDLSLASAKLWDLDIDRLVPGVDYAIDLQTGKKPYEQGDRAENPLFTFVDQDVLQRPAWAAFIALLDNYEFESGKAEKVTKAEKQEEDLFLTHCMKSPAMRYCHNYLVAKNLVPAQEGKFKDFLHDLWFGLYRRQVNNDSSGFEHVFVGEEKDGKVVGLHNWLQIYIEEGGALPPSLAKHRKTKTPESIKLDYLGYIQPRRRSTHLPESQDQLITVQFNWHGEVKDQSSSFIGTSPAFELALYTMCFLAGEEHNTIEVGPYPCEVSCFKYTSHGKTYIGTAFPAPNEDGSKGSSYTKKYAVTKIQAVARGKGTRQAVAACGSREEFKQKRTENKAATKIQSAQRSKVVRKYGRNAPPPPP